MMSKCIGGRLAAVLLVVTGVGSIVACKKKSADASQIQVVPIARRTIVVSTEATGTVEPVDTVAVKSQASGLIIKMPIEVGTAVKVGDLIAQIDTRNLNNDYQRTAAAQQAAQSSLQVAQSVRKRADVLLQQGVITTAEHETAVVGEANAQSALVAAQTNLRVAKQNLDYATVRAEVGGTVISKGASVGTVVSSATSNVGGGSTIVTVADLSRVRMRVLVNETDIANVHPGQAATVTVDALPNQTFQGTVEKVEPQATVQQSVTMFPVLVSLQNPTRTLLPGMNGEVTMITQQRVNVVAVPNDALRSGRDLATLAPALGIDPDSLQQMMQSRRPSTEGGSTGTGGVGRDTGSRTRSGGDSTGGRRVRADSGNGRSNAGAPNASVPSGGTTGRTRGTAQFAFVKEGTKWVPHRVRVGVTNYDYSEVLSGLQEGDQVALLGAVVVQQQREEQTQRVRSMTGNGLPGSGGTGTRTGAGTGAGAARRTGGGQ